jgi:HTH-type transcriptional regulator/antitoxin HigA
MSSLVKKAAEHWPYVAPLLKPPSNKREYDRLVRHLDEILGLVSDKEGHPLAGLASHMGNLIDAYDEKHRSMPSVTGTAALRYLMQEHQLGQGDLPEIGAQSVISSILSGKRQITIRQAQALGSRFNLPAALFLELRPYPHSDPEVRSWQKTLFRRTPLEAELIRPWMSSLGFEPRDDIRSHWKSFTPSAALTTSSTCPERSRSIGTSPSV